MGLNHKTAPVEVRERLSIPSHQLEECLKSLEIRGVFRERLLLSTCNRTEIYGAGLDSQNSIRLAKEFLSEHSRLALSDFENRLYVLSQPDSVTHLFSVASGLNSMVVGETEIIGQVKEAYLAAHRFQQTGKVLNALFQRSLKVAKSLRSQTDIGTGKVSVASVAVELAEKIFERLKGVRVMVLGTGEMAVQVTKAMISKGALPLMVSKRHYERAQHLAGELGGEAVPYEAYETRIKEIDVFITSTEAPLVIIRAEQARLWMKLRHERPLFLIDMAVPRNIDQAAEKLDNVYLYNIDDLEGIADRNKAFRESQLEECSRLIRNQTGFFMGWLGKEFGERR